jgi:hypothetical protein
VVRIKAVRVALMLVMEIHLLLQLQTKAAVAAVAETLAVIQEMTVVQVFAVLVTGHKEKQWHILQR